MGVPSPSFVSSCARDSFFSFLSAAGRLPGRKQPGAIMVASRVTSVASIIDVSRSSPSARRSSIDSDSSNRRPTFSAVTGAEARLCAAMVRMSAALPIGLVR